MEEDIKTASPCQKCDRFCTEPSDDFDDPTEKACCYEPTCDTKQAFERLVQWIRAAEGTSGPW